MTRSDYAAPTFVDVPNPASPPAGAVALDAAHINAMAQAIANSARQTVVDVRDYGTKGNGSADDTAAIRAAIAAAGAGGVVYFSVGTYRAANLAPLSGQTWTGPGVLQRTAGSTASIISAADISDFCLDRLTIDGSRSTASATVNSGVFLTRATRTQIRGCTFRNLPNINPALEFRGGIGNTVQGNTFTTVGYGVIVGLAAGSTDACRNNRIIGNHFDGVDLNAVFITENVGTASAAVVGSVFDTIVSDNTIRNWGDAGIETGSGSVRSIVSGNTFTGGGIPNSAILIRDNVGTVVSDNAISGLSTTGGSKGIASVILNGTTTDLTLAGNQISGGVNGIYVDTCTGLSITGGSVTAALAEGILLTQPTQFAISGVRVVGNGQHGISVGVFGGPSASMGSITGCTVLNNGSAAPGARDGIIVLGPASTDLTISGNQVTDTRAAGSKVQRYGITVQAATNDRYVITNNNLNGNASGGLNDNGGLTKVVANNLS